MKIENFGNFFVSENVVTALDSLREAEAQRKAAQIADANVGIRRAAQYLEENGVSHTRLCTDLLHREPETLHFLNDTRQKARAA